MSAEAHAKDAPYVAELKRRKVVLEEKIERFRNGKQPDQAIATAELHLKGINDELKAATKA